MDFDIFLCLLRAKNTSASCSLRVLLLPSSDQRLTALSVKDVIIAFFEPTCWNVDKLLLVNDFDHDFDTSLAPSPDQPVASTLSVKDFHHAFS